MAIKTPLRELKQAMVCAIATDTYHGYQKDTSRVTTWLGANHEVLRIKFAHARIMRFIRIIPLWAPPSNIGKYLAETKELVAI